jgi:hypothetical protein
VAKPRPCYLTVEDLKALGITQSRLSITQNLAQNSNSTENLNLTLFREDKEEQKRAGRLAWLGHWLYEPKVAGSSPVRPTYFPKWSHDTSFLPVFWMLAFLRS